jgi:Ribbon-helix-helix protein, copG family
MPTINPRVTVTLQPEDYAILEALAKTQGVSKSSLLAEIWSMACPVMARVAKLLIEAKTAQASVKDGIREATEQALKEIEPMAAQVMLNFDLFEEAIRDSIAEGHTSDGGDVTGGAADGQSGAGAKKPPSSNTGVRFLKTNKINSLRRGSKS